MMLYLAEQGENGKIYCLGSGEARPLKEYIKDMYEATGCTARLGLGDIPYGDKQVMCLCVDKDYTICFNGNHVGFKQRIKHIICNI